MKIIVSRHFPTARVVCNLFGYVFIRIEDYRSFDMSMYNHQLIHTEQMKELGYLPFYIIYISEYLFYLAKYRNRLRAYLSISFEREVSDSVYNPNYLRIRKHYAQWRKH